MLKLMIKTIVQSVNLQSFKFQSVKFQSCNVHPCAVVHQFPVLQIQLSRLNAEQDYTPNYALKNTFALRTEIIVQRYIENVRIGMCCC